MALDLHHRALERSDAARNRVRLLDAAARLVAEHGVEHVTMQAVAEEAGVGKATLFRRFGDRNGLLLALLGEAEARFQEAYTSGPPPLGPGVPAVDRLTAFGHALIERTAADSDLGAALGRQLPYACLHDSETGQAFHSHIADLLWEAGMDGDCDMLAYALLGFVGIELSDYLRLDHEVPLARLQAAWADLVQRVTQPVAGNSDHRYTGA